ncbi:hypothetical protein KNP414_01258 [Paenibacillus mucilaginosus KNP414]|uniref:Uncharacterized protein n=1 Tax=Paenibacillus mucilaginosus (strain KNP414) TaxID=1036673 RepID=F8FHC1_PAEMK|nr:hypothetical protein KNP414_01258 [Paenibacillus mucilaginosus KNP414]
MVKGLGQPGASLSGAEIPPRREGLEPAYRTERSRDLSR